MLRVFICTGAFEGSLRQHKDSDSLLILIEKVLLNNPLCGDVIVGTGGVRKFRLEDKERNKGKRGGLRILYLDLPKMDHIYLLFMYRKNEFSDISSEDKKIIKTLVERIKKEDL